MKDKRNLPQELFEILNPILPFFALIQDYKQDPAAIRIAFDGILYGFIVDKLNLDKNDQQGKALVKTAIVDLLRLSFEKPNDLEQVKKIFQYYKDNRNIIGKNFFDQMMVHNQKKAELFNIQNDTNTDKVSN